MNLKNTNYDSSLLLSGNTVNILHWWKWHIADADPSGHAVEGVGLRPFAYWDCRFESRRGHGSPSLVSVAFCEVEVSATGWSLVQRSPTECGVSECDREALITRRPWPTRGLLRHEKKKHVAERQKNNSVLSLDGNNTCANTTHYCVTLTLHTLLFFRNWFIYS
jgi:hypothetical protein